MAPLFTGFRLSFGRSADAGPVPFSATGGTILTPGNGYAYHVFISSDSFVVSSDGLAEVLIVAGGGGGGGYAYGGGGGAGGVVYGSSVPLSAQTYTVTIGSGGAGVAPGSTPIPSNKGAPSSFGSVTALGGGAGGTFNVPGASALSGGSSGGPSQYVNETINSTPQPVPGDYIAYGSPSIPLAVGSGGEGGGGAGAPNQPNPFGNNAGSFGGPGQAFPIFPSTIIAPAIPAPEQPYWTPEVGPQGYFAGGGGGGAYYTTANVPAGGIGGGGDGGGPYPGGPVNGWPGVNFTGGGGGGTNYTPGGVNPRNPTYNGGNGGSGIVLIRYPY